MGDLAKRLAIFRLVTGIFILLGFVASDAAGITNFWLLAVGLPLTAWGIRGIIKQRGAPQKAERFRTIKRIFGKKKKGSSDGGGGE